MVSSLLSDQTESILDVQPSATPSYGDAMKLFFDEPLFDQQLIGALSPAIYGGSDFGECFTTAARIREGDAVSWWREWLATADRVFAIAEASLAGGHRVSAREAYLRACTYYRTSYVLLFGAPVDPRLVSAFRREVEAFLKAAALFDPPVIPVEIPFEGITLPGYFYRVEDSGKPRPTLIATNGYDASVQFMHCGHAVAAVARGYNCLIFDGPGQGRVLYEQNVPMRPDWETVVRAAVDFALTRPEIDPKKIALIGWSLGGYLAPRAASGEPRLAACIADPGMWDLIEAMRGAFSMFPPEVFDDPLKADPAVFKAAMATIEASPSLHWSIVQRAFWVHGISSLAEYIAVAKTYQISSVAGRIACPTLVTRAENDLRASHADKLFAALKCPKTLVRFTAAEGAGDHCEVMARSLFHQRSFDWLDKTLGL